MLCTLTILPNIRISRDNHPAFMLILSSETLQNMMPADCSVLRTPTILPNIRISRELSRFYAHIEFRNSSKYDACGLFRATHSHNPTQYSHIAGIIPLLCSYWGGSQGLSPTYEQAHVGLDLLTLAS